MSRYSNPAMKQLTDQQVRYAPRDVRLRQIERAEQLLEQLEPEGTYRYPDLCEQITSYRPERYPDLVLTGEEAVHDLCGFIEDLTDSLDLPVESAGEPVYTIAELSRRYNVSKKTVNRWRARGLVSRRFRFGGRKQVGFLESAVERFVAKHADDVQRGARFSQLTSEEREKIIRRARRLARYGACPSEISRFLARKTGRSPETIRYTLKCHDRAHPEAAVFPQASAPLTEEQKQEIFRSFRRGGMTVERLVEQYGRTRASIYRIVAEVRAARLLERPIDYIDSPEFHQPGADDVILGPAPVVEKPAARVKPPPGLPPYLASLYTVPLLTREEEGYYFRKMNYLKFKAAELRSRLDRSRPKNREMDRIEEHLERSVEVKNFLIRSNLRLVVSIAKRHVQPHGNFFEMVSDGNMSLIRAIEKFDYSRGNKFSTYATWAIMKNFARSIPAEHVRLDRFRTGKEEVFAQSTDERSNPFQQEMVHAKQHEAIMRILSQLDERERDIIVCRYGLLEGTEPETLEQVGKRFGVTKERIRQLESRGLQKARKIAEAEKLDIPGI